MIYSACKFIYHISNQIKLSCLMLPLVEKTVDQKTVQNMASTRKDS